MLRGTPATAIFDQVPILYRFRPRYPQVAIDALIGLGGIAQGAAGGHGKRGNGS